MESNERVFRHPIGKIAIITILLLVIGIFALFMGKEDYFSLVCFGSVFVVSVILALLYLPKYVKISDEEITAGGLFGSKALRWQEITRFSVRGQSLRLHDQDENVTLSINSQFNGYKDILDFIFTKRPDLFDVKEDNVLPVNILFTASKTGSGLILILFFAWTMSEQLENIVWAFAFIFSVGLVFVISWIQNPQKVILDSQTLTVKSLFKETSYKANEINSITLMSQIGSLGSLSVQLVPITGKTIVLPAFKHGSAISHKILKRWHEKAVSKQ